MVRQQETGDATLGAELTIEWVDQVSERKVPGSFTWDCYFTNARTVNHAHSKKDAQGNPRAYVGDLKFNHPVMMANSLLTSQLKLARARDWALCKLMTIGEASRAMLRETLRQTLAWAVDQIVNRSRKHKEVLMKLGPA